VWCRLFVLAGVLLALLPGAAQARGPIPPSVFQAVRLYWKSPQERIEAFDVAWCESKFSTTARNGQYENIFQMGLSERRRYGWHAAGSSPRLTARAAYRYYRASGSDWSPWECKPRA
jgi:hypothetical protein